MQVGNGEAAAEQCVLKSPERSTAIAHSEYIVH